MHNLSLVAAFAFHTIAATILFALIGGATALLNVYIALLEKAHMAPLIISAIHATEYVVFGIDLVCFLIYVGREAWLLIRHILGFDDAKTA